MSDVINFFINSYNEFLYSLEVPSRYSLIKQKGIYIELNTQQYIQLANLY